MTKDEYCRPCQQYWLALRRDIQKYWYPECVIAGQSHIRSGRVFSLTFSCEVTCCLLLLLASASAVFGTLAFDINGFKGRAETTLAEYNAKRLADSNATLARLDEMIAIGAVGTRQYGVSHPKYARLMDAAIADVPTMKGMTDVQIEEKWGETGTGGDAVGVPLKSLGENSEQRAYLELVVGPATQYIFVKKWQSAKRAKWLEQARDEAVELLKHLETIQHE
jgi:hypothetical protein